jgi:DNA invertase Pin-like site-specific DNA recombinase
MKTTYYLRISTDSQDEASQRQIIGEWADGDMAGGGEIISDTASGSKPWQERKLAAVLEMSAAGDRIVVSEISRIARSTVGVLTFLQAAALKAVTVVAVRNKLALDDSMHSKITVTVLALAAEIERDLMRERTKAALAARRAAGLALGRPIGSRSRSKLETRQADIQGLLNSRVSKRAIARVIDCSPGTLYRFLDDNSMNPEPRTRAEDDTNGKS